MLYSGISNHHAVVPDPPPEESGILSIMRELLNGPMATIVKAQDQPFMFEGSWCQHAADISNPE